MPLSKLTEIARSALPPQVSLSTGRIASYQRALANVEKLQVQGLGYYRLREFIAGRAIAKEVMLNFGVGNEALPRDPYGCPVWPETITGSISHKGGLCGALAAQTSVYDSVGFDIEFMEDLEESVWVTFTSETELDSFPISTISKGQLANILFSSKEAHFKALFPLFRHATPSMAALRPEIKLHINHMSTQLSFAGYVLSGGVTWSDKAVLSWVLIPH